MFCEKFFFRAVKSASERLNLTERCIQNKMPVKWVQQIESETYHVNVLDVACLANFFSMTTRDLLDEGGLSRYLTRKIENIREAAVYGKRPRRKFREAATRYLNEFAWKRSIERDARALKALDPFIGDVWLDCVHNESFKAYIDARHRHPAPGCKRVAAGTINRDLAVARRILNLSARLWRDEGSTLT
jgi:hypothetical protein